MKPGKTLAEVSEPIFQREDAHDMGFAPFFHEGYHLVKYTLFPDRTPGQADPVGVAVLKRGEKVYTSIMWERKGGYVYAEPVAVV